MTRALTLLLLLASTALVAWTWVAATSVPTAGEVSASAVPLPAPPRSAPRDDGQRRRDEVAMILARPLFSPSRRPREEAAAAAPAATVTALPRMTAILIDGKLRSAIFDGNGKPTVLSEGGHLGPFTIQSIEPQQVTVIGPDGKRVVRTSFSNDPPPAMPVASALPQGLPFPPPLAPAPLGAVVLPPGFPIPPAPGQNTVPSR